MFWFHSFIRSKWNFRINLIFTTNSLKLWRISKLNRKFLFLSSSSTCLFSAPRFTFLYWLIHFFLIIHVLATSTLIIIIFYRLFHHEISIAITSLLLVSLLKYFNLIFVRPVFMNIYQSTFFFPNLLCFKANILFLFFSYIFVIYQQLEILLYLGCSSILQSLLQKFQFFQSNLLSYLSILDFFF